MKKKFAVLLMATLLSSTAQARQPAPPNADDEPLYAGMRLLQAQTAEEKRAFVAAQLQLDETQAPRFWPVFEEHQEALSALNQRRLENILAYARAWNDDSLDDSRAAELAEQALSIEEDETALLKHTYHKLKRVVPASKAVSYLQLESKIRAVVRYEQAVSVPLLP
ncbi:hypothetical protein [Pseudoxanthomonas koreensis]|uniref:hypothetical protein n=1 Tax=Pseudoxanthomonas koreensis TaxID=266061 RepID=UPI001391EAE6|nr:hypothetical protein [Pseudoxanthomonas koreensis]KAF1690445.1 hypothetical protein CSC64_11405 [Pseudoxanthomonas koreensis]